MPLEPVATEDITQIAHVTSHSQLFYNMPPASLEDLVQSSELLRSATETELFSLAESRLRMSGLFLILEGSVVINDITLGRGAFFGEAALFEIPMAAIDTIGVARTHSGCTCLHITREKLEGWLARHPTLAAIFFRHLSAELCQRLYLRRELSLSA